MEPAQRRGGRVDLRRRRRHHRLRRQPPPRPAGDRRRPAADLRQPPDAGLCGAHPLGPPGDLRRRRADGARRHDPARRERLRPGAARGPHDGGGPGGGALEDLAVPDHPRGLARQRRRPRGAHPGAARAARPPVRVLVAAEELRTAESRPVLLDVRWALGDDRGHERYLEAHLPGAVFVDLEAELADPPSPERGRHPLPSLQRLQDTARRGGIRTDDRVVVYDDTGGAAAARAWWLLRWAGLADVRLLDGGLQAWQRAGGAVEAGEVVPEPGDVILTGGGLPTLTLEEA